MFRERNHDYCKIVLNFSILSRPGALQLPTRFLKIKVSGRGRKSTSLQRRGKSFTTLHIIYNNVPHKDIIFNNIIFVVLVDFMALNPGTGKV